MRTKLEPGEPLYRLYPESDGKPLSESTLQFRWIVAIAGGLDALFINQPDVFVTGDLLWYPVEGRPDLRTAPDVLVAFGRPKAYRGAYMQWCEAGIPPQVVFEVLAPANRPREMVRKFEFYQKYGVEEYYIYDPDSNQFEGWQRVGNELHAIQPIKGWVSPRLALRFDLGPNELEMYRPDGRRLPTYADIILGPERFAAQSQHLAYVQAQWKRAEARADALVEAAQQRADARAARDQYRLEQERQRLERKAADLAARLRALGIDPHEEPQ